MEKLALYSLLSEINSSEELESALAALEKSNSMNVLDATLSGEIFDYYIQKQRIDLAGGLSIFLIRNKKTVGYFLIGILYNLYLDDTEENTGKALMSYEIATSEGHSLAPAHIGMMYYYGKSGIQCNFLRALEYLKISMNRGDIWGRYHYINMLLFDGSGGFQVFEKLQNEYKLVSQYPIPEQNCARNMANIIGDSLTVRSDNDKIWDFHELIEKLKKEDKEGYYYRGQNKHYDGPLCSSLDRDYSTPETIEMMGPKYSRFPVHYAREDRLRKTGEWFFFINKCYSNNRPLWPENVRLQYSLNEYLRMAYGYAFSMALCQQAGYQSEGLDVTSSLPIAVFFASYDYKDNSYLLSGDSYEGVIYRWKNLKKENSEVILHSHFYEAPNLIPVFDIFESLSSNDYCDLEHSIRSYKKAINWGEMHDYVQIKGKRPFDLIKIPLEIFKKSRIYKQKAALLFPDHVYSESKYLAARQANQEIDFPYSKELDMSLVQDLSDCTICETFKFRKNPQRVQEYLKENEITNPHSIYDDNDLDLSHVLLNNLMESFYAVAGQTLIVEMSNHNFQLGFDYNTLNTRLREIRALRQGNPRKYYFSI